MNFCDNGLNSVKSTPENWGLETPVDLVRCDLSKISSKIKGTG